ncbi:MAG TPA: hypothetical protein VGC31_09560 [Paenirhodobacter sp.]
MSNLPELKIKIGADGSSVGTGTGQAKKSLKDLDKGLADMARNAAKTGAAIAAVFVTGAASIAASAKAASQAAVEINNLAQVANTSTTTFQKWALAAKSVGVEQEKVSDILKDVTERVGEFISTGGGPMADFFENIAPKVGVTADQFARLSGPEALQLYVDSLEKAGLSQDQMTYYLESMSGDLTRLLPLLRNGGSEMTRLGDAAEAAGKVISEDMIRGGVELDKIFSDISDTLRTSATKAVLEHKDQLIALAAWIADTGIPAISGLIDKVAAMAGALQPAIDKWNELAKAIAIALGLDVGPGAVEGNATEKEREAEEAARTRREHETSTTGTWPLDENGNVIMDDGDSPLITKTPVVIPSKGASGSKGGGGGAKGGDTTERDLDRIQKAFMSEQELLQEQYDQRLEQLQKARDAELLTEEQYNAMKLEAQASFNEASAALDREALRNKLDAWSGALGDLSSLMDSGNKKLFAIGKASAIAQAVVEGYSAAVTAWDKGMKVGGPPTAAAFTAMSLARTGAMIASLKSTSYGGGSSGSSSSSSSSTTSAATQAPLEVRLTGDGSAVGWNDLGTLLTKLNEEAGDRGYKILVAR